MNLFSYVWTFFIDVAFIPAIIAFAVNSAKVSSFFQAHSLLFLLTLAESLKYFQTHLILGLFTTRLL